MPADQSPQGSGSSFAIEDVLEILERRKWWIGAAALLGILAGFVLTLLIPPVYTSRTTILVEPQEIALVQSTVTLGAQTRLHTLKARVTSYANLNELIDRVGAERLDPSGRRSREAIMGQIRGRLQVGSVGGGRRSYITVFEVAYTDDDPRTAADVAREVANLFITENVKDRARQAAQTDEFLDRELDRLRAQVTAHEEEIRSFKEERLGLLPGQLDANLRSLDRLNFELAANLESQEAIAQRIALMRQQVGSVGEPGTVATALQNLRQRLFEAQIVYTEEHPTIKSLRSRVARLEAQLQEGSDESEETSQETGDATLAPGVRNALLELDERKRHEARLRAEIDKLTERVERAPAIEQEFQDLTRDYGGLLKNYYELLSKKFQSSVARNLEFEQKGEQFKVLRPAQVPGSPSWPDPLILLPAGLVVGLVIVALLIGVGEYRNPSFRSISRLTRTLGLPVIASIPRIEDRIFESTPEEDVDRRLVVYTAPESAVAEQYRGFVPLFVESDKARVILVTSASRGDGKSLTTMNLALTLACDINRKVLVIDGDLRRPTAHRLLRVSRRRGLSDVLRNGASLEEAVVATEIPNLKLLPAGPSVRNPLALLTDKSFFDLLAEARRQYDAILIDSPPMLPVVDTRILRRIADLVLFVVRADSTPRDAVIRSLRELRDVGGVIFNQVSRGSYQRYYYYDAYSRYAYGEPQESPDADSTDA